ncbi:twisted gastrulation protein homolog 1-A-like [Daphnia carinata]|uniref:twisted gastrulation protein homolog 1-A-like n=1 Tax=Daphnia carinata TaxID=120202 RepID=UPI00257A931F|nr:twisted gastrulation protein homolog 1-A-like [Daphnia carinata]
MGPGLTMPKILISLTFALPLLAIVGFFSVQGCNEAVCASIVSKCMLTQSCKCELRNCTCCKECFSCLDYLYAECCSCVEMCPKPNNTVSELSRKSHVEDLTEPTPDLFSALTDDRDTLQRWLTFTFPVDLDITIFKPKEIKYKTINSEQEVIPLKDLITVNCTVAYMSQCMSWNKCKASCISMGASSYRWFHDGCCECVGHTCINYGINESRCLECPGEEDDNPIEPEAFVSEDYENGETGSEKDVKKVTNTEEKVNEKQVEATPPVA